VHNIAKNDSIPIPLDDDAKSKFSCFANPSIATLPISIVLVVFVTVAVVVCVGVNDSVNLMGDGCIICALEIVGLGVLDLLIV
jgi:hypothetical protein